MQPAAARPFPAPKHWLLLAGGLGFLLLFCLGTRGLNEPDEGRYASMALAMVRTGDWWVPRLSGYEHYDKPPLLYWATAAGLRAFGVNEWAARVPSLLGAVMALAGLGWAAARRHGARTAWWAVAVCGTLVQFWACARLLTPDMLLTGWCALAIGAWSECRHRGGAWRWWLVSLVFWTLAWWTKATPALVPMLGLAAGTWLAGDRAGWRALRLPLLLPATLLLGAPWFVSVVHLHPDLREFFLGRELAGRLAGGAHRRGGPFLYYLPVSAAGWLPWWPLAGWLAWRKMRNAERGTRNGVETTRSAAPGSPPLRTRLGVEGWMVLIGLLVFSLNGSKLPTYTLVLAPWAALAMARVLARLASARAGLATAGGFALVALSAAAWAPTRESSLGANSSLREVCRYLQAQPPGLALFDRHWPGVEFYLPPGQMRYLLPGEPLRQRTADLGLAVPTFLDPAAWPDAVRGKPIWTVRYVKERRSPFDPKRWREMGLPKRGIGDFLIAPRADFLLPEERATR